jgi:hypothetical protein
MVVERRSRVQGGQETNGRVADAVVDACRRCVS